MAGKSTLIATTSNWEYIDVELILTASAGATSAYIPSIWNFTKGTKSGVTSRKYYLYVANKDRIISNVTSLMDIEKYQNKCSGVSQANLGADHVNWANGSVKIGTSSSSKISFAVVLVSSNSAENTEDFGLDLGRNRFIYDYRSEEESQIDPETGLPYKIEKCVAYDEIIIDNPYWTYTEPSSSTEYVVYGGHVPDSVHGVIGSDDSNASNNIRRTQGGINFKAGTSYSVANGSFRVGKYEFCAFAPFNEEYLGWIFYRPGTSPSGSYTPDGRASDYEWNGTDEGFNNFMSKGSGVINHQTWFAAAFKSSSGQVKITFKGNKPEDASGSVTNMPSNIQGDLDQVDYLTIPNTKPNLTNYKFLGWGLTDYSKKPFIDAGQTYNYARRRSITLYAIWVPQIFVYYYKNDGNTTGQYDFSPVEKIYNKVYRIHSATTRTGYSFSDWNTKADGTGISYSPNDKYTANENLSLYAQWALNYKKIWLYNGSSWKQGIPWVYTGSEWKKGKSAWIYNGTTWKEEK